jgi:hypothetical protein
MRKNYPFPFLLFILILSISNQNIATSQNIPNPGFENWTAGEPDDWNTINQTILGTSFIPVTRDQSNPHSGTSCVKLETITQNVFLVGPVTMPGILSLGEITLDILNQTGTVDGGVPVSGYPTVLNGWFRYQPALGDSCIIGIGLSKWNGSSRDTIAYSYLTIGGLNTNWQEFALPIEYLIQAEPDTMNIIFFSSNLLTGSPTTGSKLWVDDLSLFFSAVDNKYQLNNDNFRMFAAENGRTLVLASTQEINGILNIYDLRGTLVYTSLAESAGNSVQIPLPSLTRGLYVAGFSEKSGKKHNHKFIVQ